MHIYTEYEDLSDSLKHAYTIQNEFVFKAHNTEEILTGTHKHRTICLQCPIFFSEKTFFKTWDLTTKTRDYIPSLLRRLADLTTQSHQRDPYDTRKSAQTFFTYILSVQRSETRNQICSQVTPPSSGEYLPGLASSSELAVSPFSCVKF